MEQRCNKMSIIRAWPWQGRYFMLRYCVYLAQHNDDGPKERSLFPKRRRWRSFKLFFRHHSAMMISQKSLEENAQHNKRRCCCISRNKSMIPAVYTARTMLLAKKFFFLRGMVPKRFRSIIIIREQQHFLMQSH